MKHNFQLKTPSSTSETLIYFTASCLDQRLRISIKRKVLPAHWDFKQYRCTSKVKDRDLAAEYEKTNSIITRIQGAVTELIDLKRLQKAQVLSTDLQAVIDPLIGRADAADYVPPVDGRFHDVLQKFINDRRIGAVVKKEKKDRFSPGRIRLYELNADLMKAFDEWLLKNKKAPNVKGRRLTLDGFDENMYNLLIQYCQQERNMATSTIGSHIAMLKAFFRATYKREHQNNGFADEWFHRCDEASTKVALDDAEIQRLYELKIPEGTSKTKIMTLARDWFVIDCHCGLRISDIKALDPDHLKENNTINLINIKTGAEVEIPLHWMAQAILKKHRGFPPKISDQKINENIKEVARMAGIDEKVWYKITKGGQRIQEQREKWMMISNHTARRSFITNLLLDGVPAEKVMQLAGINSYKTLQTYNKATPKQVADSIRNLPRFQKPEDYLKAV